MRVRTGVRFPSAPLMEMLGNTMFWAFVCPITNTNKKYPFHIELDERTHTIDAAAELGYGTKEYDLIEV